MSRSPRGGPGPGRPRRDAHHASADEESWHRGVHAVTELVERRPGTIERILVARGRERSLGRLLRQARHAGVPVSYVDRRVLEQRVGRDHAPHQGVAALAAACRYRSSAEVCLAAEQDRNGLVLLVDRVTDPGNIGAILRTAAAAGVSGVLLSAEDTAGVSPAAIRASAGMAERVAVAREPNPVRRLNELDEAGWKTVALDPRGQVRWDRAELDGRIVIVAGGEERGARPGVLNACRQRVSLPLAAGVESLNVSVAVGVLLFEVVRRRWRSEAGLDKP